VREKRRPKLIKNGALRKIFGLKRAEVTGGWRKLSNEELHDLYCVLDIV
jgi:hypothetical protein